VFVVDDHNVVKQREITVAHELPHLYVLSKGLDAQERIMLDGLRKVRDGDEIAVEYQQPKEAYARLEVSVQ
jgi:membrane fusion protein (multidrug efflux system)